MKKGIYFRIVELPTHQVLLTRDFDDDEESSPNVTVSFFLDGVKVNQVLGFTNEEARDEAFLGITEKMMQLMVDEITKLARG